MGSRTSVITGDIVWIQIPDAPADARFWPGVVLRVDTTETDVLVGVETRHVSRIGLKRVRKGKYDEIYCVPIKKIWL